MSCKNFNWNLKKKKGQIALFAIIAILLISAVAFLFFIIPRLAEKKEIPSEKIEIESYIQNCVKDEVNKTVSVLSRQGGYYNVTLYRLYKGDKVGYLCYTGEFYRYCINQNPNLQEMIEKQITENVLESLKPCLETLKTDIEKKNYIVNIGNPAIKTHLTLNAIVINVNLTVKAEKGAETVTFSRFDIHIASPLSKLIDYANKIVSSETRTGDFEDVTFSLLHKDTRVYVNKVDYDTIYTLKHVDSGMNFIFAVRSYVMPEGYRLA